MKSIWKFEFKIDDNVDIEMPEYAQILHVDVQLQRGRENVPVGQPQWNEIPCIWSRVDTERPMVKRRFFLTGTGHNLPDILLEHIGTFKMDQDRLVFHLFEKM
jgi:hypothetical protein